MAHVEPSSALREFIAASKAKGASDEFLAALLTRRGWPVEDVYGALGEFWSQSTGIPIPERASSSGSARDAFLYLLSFATLAMWATALGTLLFQFVDYWIPDPVSGRGIYGMRSLIAWNLAALGVAFPVYLLVMRTILREAAGNPERLQSNVRKWLTYIALLGTAGAMIGDLVAFLGTFLLGELSGRFVCKSAIVMAICGAIFAYYIRSLQWSRNTDIRRHRPRNLAFGGGALAVVAATFIAGMVIAGSPADQRKIQADQRRVEDLRRIAGAMREWNRKADLEKGMEALPASLEALQTEERVRRVADPETGQAYEYAKRAGTTYELCAEFSLASEEADPYGPVYVGGWRHPGGRHCFVLDATEPVP